jgi:hypothetical protein
MNADERRQIVLALFARRRRAGLALGVGELLAALDAIAGGWGAKSDEALKQVIQLLWCKSAEERREFDVVWEAVLPLFADSGRDTGPMPPVDEPPTPPHHHEPLEASPPSAGENLPPTTAEPSKPGWGTLPVRAAYKPVTTDEAADFHAYGPVSRRAMAYAWRYLRRPVADGPQDVLDVKATVSLAARQGYYLRPVYRRRERNHAHLLLLLDQNGSMTPFHRFNRDIVETARYDSRIEQVNVVYFHNVFADHVYLDPHLTSPTPLTGALSPCDETSSLLIVSDAGAARGYRNLTRIRRTAEFLAQLKRASSMVAWLNPMPQERWAGSSAEMIARFVPMYPLDPEGLGNAVDVLRGQKIHIDI